MTSRRPLVIEDGLVSELSQGDTVQTGGSSTEVVAGSGLVGGGSVGPNIRLDFAVAPNPSGVIYVGDTIGNDGVASVNATVALASGNKAAAEGSTALSSGNAALSTAVGALASGNAALDLVPTLVGGGPTAVLTAASAVASGYSVGVDDAGKVQSIGLTVTSNPLSFPSSAVVFESGASVNISATYDSTNNRVVIAYTDNDNSQYGTAIVGTVSGTSISFGTAVVFESATTSSISTTYDSTNNKAVITYADEGNSFYGTAIVGTVSGTSISFGTAVVFESTAGGSYGITGTTYSTYDSTNNRVVIAYRDGYYGYGNAIVGTVSGTSISFDTPVVFASSTAWTESNPTYDSTSDQVVIPYRDAGNSYRGTAIVGSSLGENNYRPTINSYPNFLGISQSTVASGSPCLVNLPGALYTDPTAGLTTGEFYYADPTTSGVTTTSTKPTSWDGQVPWNYIGRAVTSSGLMLLKSI